MIRSTLIRLFFLTSILNGLSGVIQADDELASAVESIFVKHCFDCHSGSAPESEFRLDGNRTSILAGGESEIPAIVPGDPGESSLLDWISAADQASRMPPEGEKLSDQDIETIRKWIEAGAKMKAPFAASTGDLWSLKPLSVTAPPMGNLDEKVASQELDHPIDRFLQAKRSALQLGPSPRASRHELLRRLSLVVTGLPPDPEAVSEFEKDRSPSAYTQRVDQMLSEPGYGERWAQHWLDIVRFGETHGFETNRERPNAWPYRDYVIESINDDKPYFQFVKEQLAGDQLGADIATGFLVAGPHDIVKSPDINLTLMQRQDELTEMVNVVGTAFLGLTVGCARCHNHKFDPIGQADFYSVQALFAGVQHADRTVSLSDSIVQKIGDLQNQIRKLETDVNEIFKKADRPPRRAAVNFQSNSESFERVTAKIVRFTIGKTTSGEPCIDEWEIYSGERNVALSSQGSIARASSNLPGYDIHQIRHINDGKPGNSFSWISNEPGGGWIEIEFPKAVSIDRMVWGRDRTGKVRDRLPIDYRIQYKESVSESSWRDLVSSADRAPFGSGKKNWQTDQLPDQQKKAADKLIALIAERERELSRFQQTQLVYAGTFSQPPVTHRLYRGEPLQKREAVAPNTLSILGDLKLELNAPENQRRLAFANWLAAQKHLIARVMVNRIWQHTFGIGLVPTPNDFGNSGQQPTHPELLDWLAAEFIQSDGSIKHVHRLILTSNAFRQSSRPNAIGMRKDAGSSLLWRFPPRRLAAEPLRDSILMISGALNRQMGGKGFDGFEVEMENVRHFFPKKNYGPGDWRRMIYMTKVRQEKDSVFGAFDCPDASQIIDRRSRSTTPLQSLNLLNSRFVLQQAAIMATAMESQSSSRIAQVRAIYQIAYSRTPTPIEVTETIQFVEEYGLAAFCRVILNSNEFLFIQ